MKYHRQREKALPFMINELKFFAEARRCEINGVRWYPSRNIYNRVEAEVRLASTLGVITTREEYYFMCCVQMVYGNDFAKFDYYLDCLNAEITPLDKNKCS